MNVRDRENKEMLERIHEDHPWYGHRRIAWMLKCSYKKARRLMKKFGIQALVNKKRSFVKKADLGNPDMHGTEIGGSKILNHLAGLCPVAPHTVWRSDFTHIIYRGIHLHLATVLDDFTKEIVGYALSFRHTQDLILAAIRDAIEKTGGIIPEFFHSDQGSEYRSFAVMEFLQKQCIAISMSAKSSPWQNGAQESYYGKFKLELGSPNDYVSIEELILGIHRQIHYYNHQRLHTTIQDTPVGFRQKHEEKVRAIRQNGSHSETLGDVNKA